MANSISPKVVTLLRVKDPVPVKSAGGSVVVRNRRKSNNSCTTFSENFEIYVKILKNKNLLGISRLIKRKFPR